MSIVGSSTVYPFTAAVAKRLASTGRFKMPRVESAGTGGGIKLFCAGVGVEHPDVANASRRIKQGEVDTCARNGVKDIIEVKIGYDGIVLARSRKSLTLKLTRRDVYVALAKEVPNPADPHKLIANPHTTWQQVNPTLPGEKIEVFGPPPGHGTRDAFAELVLEAGCNAFPWVAALKDADPNRYKRICHTVRDDGVYVDAGDDYDLIAQKVVMNPNAIGIVGYSFLKGRRDKLIGGPLDGFGPTFETISEGRYTASRPLYIYVKKAHVGLVPGLEEFVTEYVSEQAMGPQGYLIEKGLIPPSEAERPRIRAEALTLTTR